MVTLSGSFWTSFYCNVTFPLFCSPCTSFLSLGDLLTKYCLDTCFLLAVMQNLKSFWCEFFCAGHFSLQDVNKCFASHLESDQSDFFLINKKFY